MKRISLIAAAMIASVAFAKGGHSVHWGYSGENGPAHWGDLDEKFLMCKIGKNQSPVDLNRFVEADLPKMQITYAGNAMSVVNNGHTIQVNTMGANTIKVDGVEFTLKQFHFHTPSENHIDGKSYPMEAHFVHLDKDSNIAVIALMFEEGAPNKAIDKFLSKVTKEPGEPVQLAEMFNPGELFPKNLDYYRFNGSLTTPPCSEGVRWLVLKHAVTASKEQLDAMRAIMGKNNRPIQPLNARCILK